MNRRTDRGNTSRGQARAARSTHRAVMGGLLSVGVLAVPVLATSPAAAATPAATGWIRFAHFATDRQPVSVTVDGASLTASASFETVTPYRMVSAGVHTVVVKTLGATTPVIVGKATVTPGGAVTVSAVDAPTGLRLETYPDNLSAAGPGMAKIRVIQTVASVPAVTVSLSPATPAVKTAAAFSGNLPATPASGTTIAVPSVSFGSASPYLAVAAGTYAVVVKKSTGQVLIKGTNWPVSAGTVASIVVIDASTGPTLEVIRDAVGATSTPMGGPQTGFGGAAALLDGTTHGSSSSPTEIGLGLSAAGAALAVGGLATRRRRRSASL